MATLHALLGLEKSRTLLGGSTPRLVSYHHSRHFSLKILTSSNYSENASITNELILEYICTYIQQQCFVVELILEHRCIYSFQETQL